MTETREKISIMYLFSFKSNAPELVESYWQRNGGKEAYEEARRRGKKKQAKQHTSPKPSAPVTKRSTAPSQQQPTVVEIFTSNSSSSRSSSNNVTPEIPTSKRSLSPPPSTKDKHNKRIRHDEDEDEDNQVSSLSSPVKEPRAVEKESPEPIMEAAEDKSQQAVDLTDEEPQQSPVVAIPEEEPEPSNDEVIQEEPERSLGKETPEEEPQRSSVKETPEEEPQQPINPPSPEGSQQTVVAEDTSKEPEEDMMVNAEEDELMEEAPARDVEEERSTSRQLSPDQHMATSDTDMVDELLMTDEEVDKPTTTSTTTTTTKPTEDASSSSSPSSKLSQSDIRAFVKENRLTSRTTDDSASQLDKLTSNKENIAVVSDTTMHDNEEHLMPGTPKDKQLKEIDVNDIIWDPEYPPAPCNWSEEAECVETVVADPNDKNTFHAIVRW